MIDRIALLLLIIGGINWGLVGIFQFDLVAFLFGGAAAILSRKKTKVKQHILVQLIMQDLKEK